MFKTSILASLLLLLAASCSSEHSSLAVEEPAKEKVGNVELSFNLGLEADEDLRSLTVEAGGDDVARRPLIKINEGDKINAHIYLAYADKGADGSPTGAVTMLPDPFPIVIKANSAKAPGEDNGVYAGLEATNQTVNISNMHLLRDKVWYVMGVIGGTLNNGKLEFDPNPALLNQTQDEVAAKEIRQPNIPYTFPWSKLTVSQKQVSGNTVDVLSIEGVRFKPRGLFLRFDVRNNTDHGMYVLKSLDIPQQDDYAVAATLDATPPTLSELASGTKDFGFARLGSSTTTPYSFKFGEKQVTIVTDYQGGTANLTIKDYAHYISKTGISHPYIVDPKPKTGRFWLWFADLKSTASTIKMTLVGDPLGRLRPRQNFTLTSMAIPSGKKGASAARTLNIVKYRPYTPLEYVARGNVVRSGNGDTHEGFEVGPRYGYAGGAIYDSYNAGVNFKDTDVFDITNKKGVTIKPGFVQANRFIPTVNDWRTVVPNFNEPTGVAHEKQWAEEDWPNPGVVKEGTTKDILGYASGWNNGIPMEFKTFGSSPLPQIPMGKRGEFTRFRSPDGTYADEATVAHYYRIGNNTIVGYRYVRRTKIDFAERRKYFCAYRIEFTSGAQGKMLAREVYIGEDTKIANGASNAEADEEAWLEVIKTDGFWSEREAAGEVIVRNFPRAGFAGPGLYEDTFARYFTSNRDSGNRRYPLISYEFAEDGFRKMFSWNFLGNPGNSMQLRYFVTDPGVAYQEWGSRN